ncbi:hypothetical protein ACX9I7_05475 [Streptomyces sp. L500]
MKRTILRAAVVPVLAAVAFGIAAPSACAATAPTKAADATSGPSVTVGKIFLGKGIVASVDVSFDYVCTDATDHVAVELVSGPTTLKATKAKGALECDGAKHTSFVEWAARTVATDTPAKATAGLYTKQGGLQARVSEKTMKPGYGLPPFGN